MKKIDKSTFSKGYNIKKVITIDNKLQKSYNSSSDSSDHARYPNGMAGFVLLLLAYILFTVITLSVGFTNFGDVFNAQWQNTVLGGGLGYFLGNALWFIGRSGLFNLTGYGLTKFGRIIHFDNIKEKVAKFTINSAIKDVNNLADYKSYSETRKDYTKKWYYISLITSTVIAVISVVIYLIIIYI